MIGSKRAATRARRGRSAREFLPAALEVLETPASPLGRAVALALCAFFLAAILWALIGSVDIVAVAHGRIVPVGGVKLVQPLETGTVRATHVRDGQHVAAGDLLIELDPTESEVNRDQLLHDLMEAAVETARLEAMLDGLAGDAAIYEPPAAADPVLAALHGDRLRADLAAHKAQLASYEAERERLVAARRALAAELAKLRATLPIVEEREAALRALEEQGHAARPQWLEARTSLIENRHDADILAHRITQADAAIAAAELEGKVFTADAHRQALAALQDARRRLEQGSIALRSADRRERQHSLRAPVAGTVQQLAVHTIGGVVTPAEPLLVVVPDDADLEVQAFVLNRDKGFVRPGQEAVVKLEAFPFTRYGFILGEVLHLSGDAIEDEVMGAVYDARIALAAMSIHADGHDVPLVPGMKVTVEIRTGERRLIDFILSPLIRYKDEALRER